MNRNIRGSALFAALTGSLLAGCSSQGRGVAQATTAPPAPVADAPGACPRGRTLTIGPVSTQLGLPLSWFRVERVRDARSTGQAHAHPEDDRRTVTFDPPVPVRAHPGVETPANGFEMSAQAVSEVAPEVARGAEVMVGVARDGEANTVVSLRKDGSVVFLGVCRDLHSTVPFTKAYERLRASGYAGSQRDFLFAAIDDQDGPEARALSVTTGSEPSWEDVPPDLRVLAPDARPAPPAALMASLTQVHVTLRLPAGWRDFPGGLCTRGRHGWTSCASFSVTGDVVLDAYVEDGERPQVWLLADPDALSTAVGKAGDAPPGNATLYGDATIATYDDLRQRVTAGQPVLRATA